MKPRSGLFRASNDYLIEDLLKDDRYTVRSDGTVWFRAGNQYRQTGKAKTFKNGKQYHHLKFKGANLLVHRIVYRKFLGRLATDLVVNHKDGNGLNNRPTNLELVTQSDNIQHAHECEAAPF
jgi:hypothetical protein